MREVVSGASTHTRSANAIYRVNGNVVNIKISLNDQGKKEKGGEKRKGREGGRCLTGLMHATMQNLEVCEGETEFCGSQALVLSGRFSSRPIQMTHGPQTDTVNV